MANNVNIPAQGTGDTTPKVSTDQVTADQSQVQNFQLTSVSGGVLTRNPTIPVSNASLPLPAGASTEATLAAANTAIGTTGDAASSTTGTVIAHLRKIRDVLVAGLPALVSGRIPVDGSGVTQPVSGTVTANAGSGTLAVSAASLPLPTGAAADATLTGGTQKTKLVDTGGTNVGSISAAGALKVDGSAVTQPVSGTVTTTPPANASTNIAQVAGAAIAQGHGTAATAVRVELPTDGTGVVGLAAGAATIGALTANQSINNAQIAGTAADTNSGNKSAGTQRMVLATDQPQLTNPLKVDGSGVTQPVSGTISVSGTMPISQANPVQSATATLANVAGSASSVTLQASNAARKGLVIVNDSTAILYVKFGSTASTSSYTYFLPGSVSGAPYTLELPASMVYTGIVTGIWPSATGNARVTELT